MHSTSSEYVKIVEDVEGSEKDAFLKALGNNINRLRKEREFSFQEMASRCDIEKPNLVRITSKGTNVTAATLLKISQGLNVSLSVIFDFEY